MRSDFNYEANLEEREKKLAYLVRLKPLAKHDKTVVEKKKNMKSMI